MTAHNNCPSSSPSRRGISMPPRPSGWSRRWPTSTCWPTPSCARPANRSAPSRWNARSTSWRTTMGIDPIELRRRNEPEKDPTTGAPFSSRHIVEAYRRRRRALRLGASAIRRRARRRDGEWLVGMGVRHRDLSLLPHARRRGAASRSTRDGRVTVSTARPRDGHGHRHGADAARRRAARPAARARVVRLRRQPRCRRARWPAARSRPPAIGRGGDRRGRARCSHELLKLAGNDTPLAGLKADEVVARDGGLAQADDPARHESYASILARARARQRRGRGSRAAAAGEDEVLDALARRAVLRGAASTR